MAVDMFLKLDKIKGEAQDGKHKDEIDVLAWSWGMSQSGTTHMGSGGGGGKANFQDISVTKYVDAATKDLISHLSKGTHISEGTLVVRKAGDTPLEYIVITMKDIIVTSLSTGGSGGEDRLTENITLNFSEFKYSYVKQEESGAGAPSADFSYNIAKNEEAA